MLQVFHVDVASVSCGCCKCRSRFCICCNSCTHMLQVSILNFICFLYTYVASVSNAYLKCFICLFFMLQMLHLDVSKVDQLLHMLQCDSPTSASRIRSRGEADAVGALLSVAALWGYRRALVCCGVTGALLLRGQDGARFCYAGTGRGCGRYTRTGAVCGHLLWSDIRTLAFL